MRRASTAVTVAGLSLLAAWAAVPTAVPLSAQPAPKAGEPKKDEAKIPDGVRKKLGIGEAAAGRYYGKVVSVLVQDEVVLFSIKSPNPGGQQRYFTLPYKFKNPDSRALQVQALVNAMTHGQSVNVGFSTDEPQFATFVEVEVP